MKQRLVDRWRWWRREKTADERIASLRRGALISYGASIAIFIANTVSSVMHQQWIDATGYVFLVGLIYFLRSWSEKAVDRARAFYNMMSAGVVLSQISGLTAMTFEEGPCSACSAELTGDAPGLQCVSGHRVHIACLTHETGMPPRCPLCLRR